MIRPKTLPAFTRDQYERANLLLAARVAHMMGRKFEEDDWAYVYCTAKGIPHTGWSNLNIDVMHEGLGVEHKMLKKGNGPLRDLCGSTLMHPAATRSIRIPSLDADPNEVMRDILLQYGFLIADRTNKVKESTGAIEPDMRSGWLIWQESLKEFLYFEEEMLAPNPDDYFAEWRDSGGGSRKESKNLWVYEKETGRKRYSITTSAGAKIQPYFDVPPPNDPYLYLFRVQSEDLGNGLIRLWITEASARELRSMLGDLSVEKVSSTILEAAKEISQFIKEQEAPFEVAIALIITADACTGLVKAFPGVSDEHMVQLFLQHLISKKK
jgi:hypothetical protein